MVGAIVTEVLKHIPYAIAVANNSKYGLSGGVFAASAAGFCAAAAVSPSPPLRRGRS